MTGVTVYVALDGHDVLAGTLYSHRRRGTESATYAYAPTYLATPGAYALDPELPLTSGTHQTRVGRALFGALTDSAPDRWGRTLVTRREAALARVEGRAPRALAEIDYLLGVRDDLRQGALRFRVGTGPFLADDDAGVPALTDLPALLELAARADSDTADLPDLQRLVRVGSSLGGARPKAHVLDRNGRVAIAKFPSANHDTWNVMAWEKVALDLAERAGIDVPPSRLLHLAGRSVLIVDRFDRDSTGHRIGYVSAMTMLEASDGEQRSYLEIAEVVETASVRATEELRQLWRRIVFSVLISNTDDHLRNHGFLHERGDVWRLAPAFDLNPNPAPGPKYLSTAIDDISDTASLASALAVAEHFRLSDTQARAALREVGVAVSGWREVAGQHGLTPSEIAAMESAFTAGDDAAALTGSG
ncbi:MAG: type II toxin-antitoxin system HipA family toxin [Actinobacteria bacterium]|nr:type II toxin-antitoxin system HipA family toxin [Actinomycetota bacterium]